MGRIAFVVGKPPQASPIVAQVIARVREAGHDVAVHLPHEAPDRAPPWLLDIDLVIHRGLDQPSLEALLEIEASGVRCCNTVRATIDAQDRMHMADRLLAAGLPVPATTQAGTWSQVVTGSEERPLVVKAVCARRGRSAGVVMAVDQRLPTEAPFDGPYVVQDFVDGDGWDRKLYIAGHDVRALLKRRTDHAVRPLHPTASLCDLGVRAGSALGLEVYGVDVVIGSTGPYIVDVNPFPGFRSVASAPLTVSNYILKALTTARRVR